MQQFDKVIARFNPKRTDDLKSGIAAYIGRVMEFQALWIIEPDENQFEGQWAMGLTRREMNPPFAWTPLEDLEILEVVVAY